MISILVPVLGRAHQIEPLVASITNSSGHPHQIVFICSPEDTDAIAACQATKATTLIAGWKPGKADYAKKLALGYESTTNDWFFQGATDLQFHVGWDLAAMKMAQRFRRGVVGTNDLGNPLVKRGQHSTHTLISRAYIEHYGGTVDDTGVVFSEVYDHQWTDSEFIETARRRKQFIFARNSIVEHMHPHWGKGEEDDTYRKALRQTQQDQRLFMQRRELVVRNARS